MGTIMDIYPTLLSVAGAKTPANHPIDGVDLSVQLKGKKNENRPEKFLMHFPHEHRGSYFTSYRDGDWKLIYYYNPLMPDRPVCELYNLKKDPFEVHNLATTDAERLVKMVDAMADELEAENALYPVDAEGNPLRPERMQLQQSKKQ